MCTFVVESRSCDSTTGVRTTKTSISSTSSSTDLSSTKPSWIAGASTEPCAGRGHGGTASVGVVGVKVVERAAKLLLSHVDATLPLYCRRYSEHKPWTEKEAAQIVRQITAALKCMHENQACLLRPRCGGGIAVAHAIGGRSMLQSLACPPRLRSAPAICLPPTRLRRCSTGT